MSKFLITSYYTENTPYEFVFRSYLGASLSQYDKIPVYIEKIATKGSWLQNTAYKPQLCLNALEKFPDLNVVFLDSDATILTYPKLFEEIPEEYDIALHYLDWASWYKNGTSVKEALSGTLWLRNNEKIKELVKEWLSRSTSSKLWEQKCLAQILESRKDIKIYNLPLDYCFINTLPNGNKPFVSSENAVILHHQASRRYRRQV